MSEKEQDRYGAVKGLEPVQIEDQGPFVARTPVPADAPTNAIQAYNAMVRKDYAKSRPQKG